MFLIGYLILIKVNNYYCISIQINCQRIPINLQLVNDCYMMLVGGIRPDNLYRCFTKIVNKYQIPASHCQQFITSIKTHLSAKFLDELNNYSHGQ